MRTFDMLDSFAVDDKSGLAIIRSTQHSEDSAVVSLKREGNYIAIAINYGPFEIALRPRLQEFARVLGRLHPVEGLQTTRQIGTGQAHIGLGLRPDGVLLFRPTIVADATGHMSFNLSLTDDARKALYAWLPAETD